MKKKNVKVISNRSQKLIDMMKVFLIILTVCFMNSCAEDSADDGTDCLTKLDNKEFATVAANAACTDYERGSAELGLAGFLFSEFMEEDASDNFPRVFGLTSTGCTTTGTDSDGGAYKSINQKHFLRAQYFTRTKPTAQTTAEKEISLFSTLGELIVMSHCEIDTDLNGTISDTENKAFSQVNTGSNSVGSSELTASSTVFQVLDSVGNAYLIDTSDSSCLNDPNHEGVWNVANGTCTYLTIVGDVSSIFPIVKVESLQQLFDPAATSSTITKPFDFLNTYTTKTRLLTQDLAALGVKNDDDLYESVSETVGKMDNGGTCNNDSVKVLDLMTSIVQIAAPQATAADLPSTKYKNLNKLDLVKISQIDSGESIPSCPIGSCNTARLIFKQGGVYTGLYKTADSNIKSTLSNLSTLTIDASGDIIPVVKDDNKIALKELLCQSDE